MTTPNESLIVYASMFMPTQQTAILVLLVMITVLLTMQNKRIARLEEKVDKLVKA